MASKSLTKQDLEATSEEVPGSIAKYTEEEINIFKDDMSSENTRKSTSTSVRRLQSWYFFLFLFFFLLLLYSHHLQCDTYITYSTYINKDTYLHYVTLQCLTLLLFKYGIFPLKKINHFHYIYCYTYIT